ncbi:Protein phosphatase 2C [Clostridium cavendishii DSM 21758]|uniref:Protein phosphatase 2C n=1 Tax=Clostridium cavendishii DSM 21758 TaxID=1121302 RepID=A0A1M6FMQ9_9CLOT|nr:PP2C family serine/threonine-protein phosphatase [Clostridium cavendishii]SHI98933.1 Protein phosphatase 2C [Clostridium cavendishii DSM 21758]
MNIKRWVGECSKIQGSLHKKKGIPCQDNVCCYVDKSNAILSLSDGAGSCRLSNVGSKIATKTIIKLMKSNFDNFYTMEALQFKEFIISSLLDEINNVCEKYNSSSIKDFSATLLFVAIKDNNFIIGHIGDGLIAYYKNGAVRLLSEPENGETSNTTYFFTMPNVYNHFRLFKGHVNEVEGFIVMSDGGTNSLYKKATKSLALANTKIFQAKARLGKSDFKKFLQDDLIRKLSERTTDDCSIGILYRHNYDLNTMKDKDLDILKEVIGINDEKGIVNFLLIAKEYNKTVSTNNKLRIDTVVKNTGKKKKIVKKHIKRLQLLY